MVRHAESGLESEVLKSLNRPLCFMLSALTLGIVNFFSVPQGYVRVVTAFGRYKRSARPGLSRCFGLWGLYQRVSTPIPTREQVLSFSDQEVFTRDGTAFRIDTVAFFRITDARRAKFEVDDYLTATIALLKSALASECGKLEARELRSSRKQISDGLRTAMERGTAPWGITVRLVEIKAVRIVPDATSLDEPEQHDERVQVVRAK